VSLSHAKNRDQETAFVGIREKHRTIKDFVSEIFFSSSPVNDLPEVNRLSRLFLAPLVNPLFSTLQESFPERWHLPLSAVGWSSYAIVCCAREGAR
jgi:hypothetical protein